MSEPLFTGRNHSDPIWVGLTHLSCHRGEPVTQFKQIRIVVLLAVVVGSRMSPVAKSGRWESCLGLFCRSSVEEPSLSAQVASDGMSSVAPTVSEARCDLQNSKLLEAGKWSFWDRSKACRIHTSSTLDEIALCVFYAGRNLLWGERHERKATEVGVRVSSSLCSLLGSWIIHFLSLKATYSGLTEDLSSLFKSLPLKATYRGLSGD